jgi:DNA-directed RNA polymerase subunit RPC12/RpoP
MFVTRWKSLPEDPRHITAAYDFYRCQKCNRLITALEERRAIMATSDAESNVCPCGGRRYSPTNLTAFDWFKPRVLEFAYMRLRHLA